jgi:hypothetical protein
MVTTLSQKKQILKLYGIRAAPRRNWENGGLQI